MKVPALSLPVGPRRRLVILGAVAALGAVVLIVLLVRSTGSGDGGRSAAAAATPTASTAPTSPTSPAGALPLPPTPPTPTPSGPTSDVDALPPRLPAVQLDQPADAGNGIVAEVVSLEAIDGRGQGPGNIAGPALRASVRITNGTAGAVSLDAVVVDLAHGSELTPASPLGDDSAAPFQGSVDPGGTAEGVYVFSVAPEDRDVITLSVGYQAGAPFLLFTGSGR